jgi:hypothetical protein
MYPKHVYGNLQLPALVAILNEQLIGIQMASILDKHITIVMDQLNNFGASYKSVCDQLLQDYALRISRQALRSWHLRKMVKIKSRSMNDIITSPTNLSRQIISQKYSGSRTQQHSVPASNGSQNNLDIRSILQRAIHEEEAQLTSVFD